MSWMADWLNQQNWTDMSNKGMMIAMAMAMGHLGGQSLYEYERRGNGERKPYRTEDHKCRECTKFKTDRCKCSMAKETSPACSQITIK